MTYKLKSLHSRDSQSYQSVLVFEGLGLQVLQVDVPTLIGGYYHYLHAAHAG